MHTAAAKKARIARALDGFGPTLMIGVRATRENEQYAVQRLRDQMGAVELRLREETGRRGEMAATLAAWLEERVELLRVEQAQATVDLREELQPRVDHIKARIEAAAKRYDRDQDKVVDEIIERNRAIRERLDNFLDGPFAFEFADRKRREAVLLKRLSEHESLCAAEFDAQRTHRERAEVALRETLEGYEVTTRRETHAVADWVAESSAKILNENGTEAGRREQADQELASALEEYSRTIETAASVVNVYPTFVRVSDPPIGEECPEDPPLRGLY